MRAEEYAGPDAAPAPAPLRPSPLGPVMAGPDGMAAVFQALSEVRTPTDVTALICRAARELVGADGATFVVQEGQGVRYLDEDAISPLWKGQWFPVETCISGWAILNHAAAVIEDITTDPRIPQEAYRPTFVRSLVMTPVRAPQPVAAIGVYWERRHHTTESELQTLRTLAYAADLAFTVARHHEEMRLAHDAAVEANRLKDEFLATLSHELRTPLNAILGWATTLRTGALDEGTRRRAAEVIERNARSQALLIDDLLDMSRIVTGKLRLSLETLDLRSVVASAVEAVRPAAAARGVALELIDGRSLPVRGHEVRLQQVAWNLLSNAVKFTPRGGRVRVSLAHTHAGVELQVVDSGVGIPADFLPHVFDRFRQADGSSTRHHGGLGLGLSIVKQLVEAMGGGVRAESAGDGRGASFTVTLPAIEAVAETAGRETPTSGRSHDLSGVRVLVVDDDQDGRELAVMVLESRGAEVTGAACVAECLEAVTTWQPDVVVSDIGMPGDDGYSLIRALRSHADERLRSLPALALTGYGSATDHARALDAGFDDHATKPLAPPALLDLVTRLVARRARG